MLVYPRCAWYEFAGDGKEEKLTRLSVRAQGPVMEESVGLKYRVRCKTPGWIVVTEIFLRKAL